MVANAYCSVVIYANCDLVAEGDEVGCCYKQEQKRAAIKVNGTNV